MTLNNWVESGNPMLSHYCSAYCCQEIGCNERMLREMHIHDIFALAPNAGKVAKREMDRWMVNHLSRQASLGSLKGGQQP
jgi:hypothetical protein